MKNLITFESFVQEKCKPCAKDSKEQEVTGKDEQETKNEQVTDQETDQETSEQATEEDNKDKE
jgi:hypothetical protein